MAPARDERPVLEVKYSTRLSLLSLVEREGARLRLFVPAPERIPAGTELGLKVTFGDSSKNFYVGGTVEGAADAGGPSAGFMLAVESPADRRAFAHVEAFCGRRQEPARRFRASIPCTLRVRDEKVPGRIQDVSMTGAFITPFGRTAIDRGAAVEVEIKQGFLGLSTRRMRARIVWRGDKGTTSGVGAEFFDSAVEVLGLLRDRGFHGRPR